MALRNPKLRKFRPGPRLRTRKPRLPRLPESALPPLPGQQPPLKGRRGPQPKLRAPKGHQFFSPGSPENLDQPKESRSLDLLDEPTFQDQMERESTPLSVSSLSEPATQQKLRAMHGWSLM